MGYRNILDLTAGLAVDSVFLSQVGFKVTSLERHPVLFLLLKSAQKSAIELDSNFQEKTNKTQSKHIWKGLDFICTEASTYLSQMSESSIRPEVVYYDPMYPSNSKTALPSKEMQIFRNLLGENEADIDLLELAIKKTSKIAVVKRPIKAPPLKSKSNISPSRSYLGKLVRFDIYL